jgi:hypothetical protein
MSHDNKQTGRRRKPQSAKPKTTVSTTEATHPSEGRVEQIATRTTVGHFAKQVVDWLVEGADEDDIQQFVAEFVGVPIKKVTVIGDDIKIVAGQQGRRGGHC